MQAPRNNTKTHRPLAAAMTTLVAFAAYASWQAAGRESDDQVPQSPAVKPVQEGEMVDPTLRRSVVAESAVVAVASLDSLVQALLFRQPESARASREIMARWTAGTLEVRETTSAVLAALHGDQQLAAPQFVSAYATAEILLSDDAPAADATATALTYKAHRCARPQHNELKALLRGWPCGGMQGCDAATLAELKGVDTDENLLLACRLLLDRGFDQGGRVVVQLVQDLSRTPQVPGGIRTTAEIMATIFKYGQPVDRYTGELLRIPADLHRELVAANDANPTGKNAPPDAFVMASGAAAFGFALGECLANRVAPARQLDQPALDALIERVTNHEAQEGGAQPVDCSISMALGCIPDQPMANARLRNYVQRGPGAQLRTTALIQLGKLGDAELLETALMAAAAQDPKLLRSPPMQHGYLAALNNGRRVNSNCADKARRAFEVVLRSRDRNDDVAQMNVLEMLVRRPIPEMEHDIVFLAKAHPRGSIREAAGRAMTALHQR